MQCCGSLSGFRRAPGGAGRNSRTGLGSLSRQDPRWLSHQLVTRSQARDLPTLGTGFLLFGADCWPVASHGEWTLCQSPNLPQPEHPQRPKCHLLQGYSGHCWVDGFLARHLLASRGHVGCEHVAATSTWRQKHTTSWQLRTLDRLGHDFPVSQPL